MNEKISKRLVLTYFCIFYFSLNSLMKLEFYPFIKPYLDFIVGGILLFLILTDKTINNGVKITFFILLAIFVLIMTFILKL